MCAYRYHHATPACSPCSWSRARRLRGELCAPHPEHLPCLQDASSSSLLWVMALLEAHPDVLARVRDEQRALRPDR